MKIVSFVVVLSSCSLSAQPFRKLIFEGGGMRGIAYAGALAELQKRGFLDSLNSVGGTSVGAITAMMLAAGFTPLEIENEIAQVKPRKFNDGTVLFFGGPTRLRTRYGWYKGKRITHWLGNLLEKKLGNAEITFGQLHEQNRPSLYVTGTSLNNQRVLVFSHETYPNMKVRDAVRASMSIPFFFKPITIDSGGHVLKKPINGFCDIVVDGGFIANYPIDLFDWRDANGNRVANASTLGFRLDTQNQFEYDQQNKGGLAPWPIDSFRNFVGAFYNFIMENLNRSNLNQADWDRTVSISSELVGAKIRKPTAEQRANMMAAGKKAVVDYLESKKNLYRKP